MSYNRYNFLKNKDGTISPSPNVKIKTRNTDIFRVYDYDKTRLDRISYEIYEDDSYGWLILQANPEYLIEFDIPKNTVLRIPFPLREVLSDFESEILRKSNIN
jgi:hypothetical protein